MLKAYSGSSSACEVWCAIMANSDGYSYYDLLREMGVEADDADPNATAAASDAVPDCDSDAPTVVDSDAVSDTQRDVGSDADTVPNAPPKRR